LGFVAITVEKLTKRFGNFIAVDHISFQVMEGEIFGLLGPNGAGKTTTIRMMLGLLTPSSGDVMICGHDIKSDCINLWRASGYVPEEEGFYEYLNSYEYLELFGRLYKVPPEPRRKKLQNY
jgi:ABC-2 type transport system ATP-binding protein